MTRRALITGAPGQDGRYLAELLLGRGYHVFGMIGPEPAEYLAWAAARGPMLTPVAGDLTDQASLDEVVRVAAPSEVYNFAGMSSVGASWSAPELFAEINGRGVERLLSAIERMAPEAHLVQASSAEIFGDPAISPQNEDTPIAPTNPYGESKAMGHRAVQVARGQGLRASNAIFYNHESPMRPVTFVTGKIADGAARIKLGLASELRLGNLDVVRDWGFAGDYVEAMARMASAPKAGDYVVATGEGHTPRDFAREAFAYLGLDYAEYVVVDPEFFRAADATALVGDSSRIRAELGWTPAVGFSQLVQMMVDWHLDQLAGGAAPR